MNLTNDINEFFNKECTKYNEYDRNRENKFLFQNMMPVNPYTDIIFKFTNIFKINVKAQFTDTTLSNLLQTITFSFDYNANNLNRLQLSKLVLDKLDKNYSQYDLKISSDIYATYDMYGYMGDIDMKFPWTEQREVMKDFYLLNHNKYADVYSKFAEYKDNK